MLLGFLGKLGRLGFLGRLGRLGALGRLGFLGGLLLFLLPSSLAAQGVRVRILTSKGAITAVLFDDTPLHRDNFLRHVRAHDYDSLLFHRVIPAFMIQTGDSASRHALPGVALGDTPESHTIPAEIRFPAHFHQAGALAMAREDDAVNPQRASSSWQFYIVTGQPFTDDQLDRLQQRLDQQTDSLVRFTPAMREVYRTRGGAPHLDGTYTVFGQVTEGFDVLDDLQFVERDARNRPLADERILSIQVIE